MNEEIKTLKGWNEFAERTENGSWSDYARVGDVVSEEIVNYFTDILPPRIMSYGYLQVGEPHSHRYDLDRRLRPIFATFAKCDGVVWRYYGHCFAYETINRD